jgi:hypothetical protein
LNDLAKVEGLTELISKLSFVAETAGKLTKAEIKYLTGEWLEEYMLEILLKEKELPEDAIGMGWQLRKDNNHEEVYPMNLMFCSLKTIDCIF